MNKTFIHDIFAQISKTRSRFISILAIVALGAGFFVGVKSTCPDMKETAQKYFNNQELMDLHVKSTMGFTAADIANIRNESDIRVASPGYSVDAFAKSPMGSNLILRAYSYGIYGNNDLNKLTLVEGDFPKNQDECVIEQNPIKNVTYKIGDTVSLFLDDSDLGETLEKTQYKVVGIVTSPMYIDFERGNTSLGSGMINGFIHIPTENFKYEAYTDVFIRYKDAESLKFYEDEYQTFMEDKIDKMEVLAAQREKTRWDEIFTKAEGEINKAQKELDEGIADYDQGKADFDTEIAKYDQELKDASAKIKEGEDKLKVSRKEIADGAKAFEAASAEILAREDELKKGWDEYYKAEGDVSGLSALSQGAEGIYAMFLNQSLPEGAPLPEEVAAALEGLKALDQITGENSLSKALLAFIYAPVDSEQKKALSEQISGGISGVNIQVSAMKAQLDKSKETLDAGQAAITSGKAQLEAEGKKLNQGSIQLDTGAKELSSARREYNEGLEQLDKNRVEGEKKLAEALAEIEKGKREILDARHDLREMPQPKWYIFDRGNNPGYSSYVDDAERVDKVAGIFPIFFILVAALVCLTTMTRMVEEQRVQIGTLKSLGYGKGAIITKYMFYALSASAVGSVIGMAIGFPLLTRAIYGAYQLMYVMPPLETPIRWGYAIATGVAAMVCTGLSTYSACSKELKESPSMLMRPKPPRSGKRVLLERVGFIWKRLSFLHKVTIRNLFRYKKRIFMAVVGTAGCTALMLAGFGLKYSISSIVTRQYSDIFTYDLLGILREDLTALELEDVEAHLDNNENIQASMAVRQAGVDIWGEKSKKYGVYIFVPQNPEEMGQFISLQGRVDRKPIEISDEGAVVCEKIAKMLGLKVGDSFNIKISEDKTASVKISAIAENYMGNFIYMTPKLYENVFETGFEPNAAVIESTGAVDENTLMESIMENNNVLALSSSAEGGRKFETIGEGLNAIVWVLIGAAGALAFVVLYNLANINIEERIREMATIKLLGFYDKEVSSYVNRESTISALMGTAVGLAIGIPFLKFIINTAEVEVVMFNPALDPLSFLKAGLLTILFSLIVNEAMHHRLKKVDMVQSLKSVE